MPAGEVVQPRASTPQSGRQPEPMPPAATQGRSDFTLAPLTVALCGGSRGWAWALTGDALAADPTCAYEPEGAQ